MSKQSFSLWRTINAVDMAISVTALTILVIIVSIQVFCRYVLQNSLDWTEELARYLSIWSVMFGCSYAMKTDSHLEMTILRSLAGPRLRKFIHAFACLMCLLFCLIMLYASMQSIENIRWSEQLTPAMQIPAWIIWMAMPVGMGLMGIQAVIRIIHILRGDNAETFDPDQAAASL